MNLMERIQKLDRFLLLLKNLKGIKCESAVKSNVQSGSQRRKGK